MKTILKHLTALLMAVGLVAEPRSVSAAQWQFMGRVSAIQRPVFTNYLAVVAISGTNESLPSREVVITNSSTWLTWKPSTTSNVIYHIRSGSASGSYTEDGVAGTNCSSRWPVPVSSRVTVACAGRFIYCQTNPLVPRMFWKLGPADGNYVHVQSSTDLTNWVNPYTLVWSTNYAGLTVQLSPVLP